MIKRTLTVTTVATFLFFSLISLSYSKESFFSTTFGISNLTDDRSEYWNIGFTYGGNGFFQLTPNIWLGGRIVSSKFSANLDKFKEAFTILAGSKEWEISTSGTIVELVPTVRVVPHIAKDQSFKFFGQVGVGLFFVNLEATAKASYTGVILKESIKESAKKLGLSLGGGIIIGKGKCMCFEILPLYHIVFTEEKAINYFTICVGVGCAR